MQIAKIPNVTWSNARMVNFREDFSSVCMYVIHAGKALVCVHWLRSFIRLIRSKKKYLKKEFLYGNDKISSLNH